MQDVCLQHVPEVPMQHMQKVMKVMLLQAVSSVVLLPLQAVLVSNRELSWELLFSVLSAMVLHL